jgi:hypothetical protein
VAAALLLLAACGGSGSSTPTAGGTPTAPRQTLPSTAPCPRITIIADAADLTRFRPGPRQDHAALELDARVLGFNARCDFVNRGDGLEVLVAPGFEAERGPASRAPQAALPWFVAVTDPRDSQIFDKRNYETPVRFPANVARARAQGEEVRMVLPLTEGRRTGDFAVRIGFQLTPEELALNRRRGPR